MNFSALLNTVVTLFILISVGFGSRKLGLIDDAFSKKLSGLIVNIGQPMLIISSLISLEYTEENLKRGLVALAISLGLHFFVGLLAYLLAKPFKSADERKISEFSLVFTNCGFMGLPVLESLYGADGLFCGAFYLMGFHLFIWTWGMFILGRGRDDIKLTPRKILLNLGTVPCVIGFLLFLLPVKLPGFVLQSASYLASLCTPISLIITGALIATAPLRELFGRAKLYIFSAVKLLVIPTVVCLCLRAIGLDSFFVVFGTVMAAMPSASVITMFGELYSIDPGYASRVVGLTSVLSVVTLPIIVSIARTIV